MKHQEAALNTSYRYVKCHGCPQCLKGTGQENISIRMEYEQELIRESVRTDGALNRAVATLPFITNPSDKLVRNKNIAARRLENVCRKYGSNEEVKEMLRKSLQKLINQGHIKLLKDLPEAKRN